MDAQFEELAREIADSVTSAVTESVTSAVTESVTAAVTKSLDERLQGAFGDSEARIKKHIDEFESRAELRMKIHFENLEENVKMAAEGYAGTLDGIDRRLTALNEKIDTGFATRDLILRDHVERIASLERRR